ncbi:fluoride efflux transporter CrcB [Roseomonas indoligenes]|uniref:Fluoride-specific ion channel FluC n=1 Tax=Roseomonas indoligenes TaxID=2820811 RepID=A0A940S9E8_9PROT|nr:fluoride efflux transporter CrcB [Pararoseomonas indoligenes]MBP0495193.1 fluoride efflux transporter CrcB [Pararoseomonas indoligenes]
MPAYILIAIGGAIGSLARGWFSTAAARWWGVGFPWGTVAINLGGSFLIGLFAALTLPGGRFAGNADLRALVMVGICGGFTTFSSFSLQTLELLREGRGLAALGNVAGSVLLCLAATAAGYALAAPPAPPSAVSANAEPDRPAPVPPARG